VARRRGAEPRHSSFVGLGIPHTVFAISTTLALANWLRVLFFLCLAPGFSLWVPVDSFVMCAVIFLFGCVLLLRFGSSIFAGLYCLLLASCFSFCLVAPCLLILTLCLVLLLAISFSEKRTTRRETKNKKRKVRSKSRYEEKKEKATRAEARSTRR